MTDRIQLIGLRAYGYHGVLPQERSDGQWFIIDVEISADLRAAAASDRLDDTIDYGVIATRVVRLVEGRPCNLIETVAARIADDVLSVPAVSAVTVTVHKPQAPVTVPFADVCVCLSREKS